MLKWMLRQMLLVSYYCVYQFLSHGLSVLISLILTILCIRKVYNSKKNNDSELYIQQNSKWIFIFASLLGLRLITANYFLGSEQIDYLRNYFLQLIQLSIINYFTKVQIYECYACFKDQLEHGTQHKKLQLTFRIQESDEVSQQKNYQYKMKIYFGLVFVLETIVMIYEYYKETYDNYIIGNFKIFELIYLDICCLGLLICYMIISSIFYWKQGKRILNWKNNVKLRNQEFFAQKIKITEILIYKFLPLGIFSFFVCIIPEYFKGETSVLVHGSKIIRNFILILMIILLFQIFKDQSDDEDVKITIEMYDLQKQLKIQLSESLTSGDNLGMVKIPQRVQTSFQENRQNSLLNTGDLSLRVKSSEIITSTKLDRISSISNESVSSEDMM